MPIDIRYIAATSEEQLIPFTVEGLVSGRYDLLQKVITISLTSSSDPLRYYGGNLYSNLRSANTSGTGDTNRIRNVASVALTSVAQYIKSQQLSDTTLTDEEKLDNIIIGDIAAAPGSISISIEVRTVAGSTASASVTVTNG